MQNRRHLIRFNAVAVAALVVVLAGCSTPGGSSRTGRQARADKATARQVEKALAVAPIFKYPDVGVSAYVGTVQLTGLVETPEQRERAAQIAAGVTGVSRVINGIMIRPLSVGGATISFNTSKPPIDSRVSLVSINSKSPFFFTA